MSQAKLKVAFIGAGNMATAIAQGMHASGQYQILVTDPFAAAVSRWKANFSATDYQPSDVVDAIVLAVKPQQFGAVASVSQQIPASTLLISVMAGVSCAKISSLMGGHAAIVRTMPNTPARIQQGITALFATQACSEAHKALSNAMMSSIGQTVWLNDERLINAVTAVSGSGPAYVFYIAQALASEGEALGLPANIARQLSLATLQGAAALAQQTGEDLNTLREQVTSKGGTTAAALGVFKFAHLDETIQAAVRAAHSRAVELA